MKTRLLVIIIIVSIVILAVILHTELLGEHATYGECLITASSINGFMSSAGKSQSEYQCKEDCLWQGNAESNEKQNVSCKFQTISGYRWIASPEEFEYMIDNLSLSQVR
ncbi:hypothetical protein [Nitrosopumilus sp.]|uniref:hypothetical protein n=1 Tax=Nitrosopumilus sp. TaxID=2024843 RepID=UPI003B5CFBE7